MTEAKKDQILYGIVQASDLEIASMKHLGVKVDGKFIDHEYLPSYAGEFSTDKEHLITQCRSSRVHYVAPIKTNIRCIASPETINGHLSSFEVNVDRAINTILSDKFKEDKQLPRRGFIGNAGFEFVYSGAAWFWMMETKYNKAIGVRAFVIYGKIHLETVEIDSAGVVSAQPAGEGPNNIDDFVVLVEEKIRTMLGKEKESHAKTLAASYTKPEPTPYNRINISLDYDGTVTSDYDGFTAMAEMFRKRGHKVYIVTFRYESECRVDPYFMKLASKVDGYIATGRQAKRAFCQEKGLNIHVWIDDNPEAVILPAVSIWGSSSPEGHVVIEQHGTPATN